MKSQRSALMLVAGLILALGGLAGPRAFGPGTAQATTTGCANFGGGDLFGCYISGNSNSYAFRADNAGTGGNAKGLYGYASGTSGVNYGVYGLSASAGGYGVYGSNSSTGAFATGVYGTTSSTQGYGVAGSATATNSYGVYGTNPNGIAIHGTGASGVMGSGTSSGTGVIGFGGIGVNGVSTGIYAMFASNQATSGPAYGLEAQVSSPDGIGVRGYASSTSGTNYGIYGHTSSSSGYAGYFNGRVHVNGTLSKSAGSFKIDHPLDPANKYLSHSFVESPDMLNIYNGNVTLDARGQAVVELPAYFEALNQEFRYQLTAIGAPGPNLYVAEKIKGNRFKIAGGKPGTEVSWQVTGVRHDPYAEQHRIEVEQDKPAEERGTYLYPQGYGQPETKARDYKELQRPDVTRLAAPDQVPAP